MEHLQLFDLIEKMLEYFPEERIGLKEALSHPFFKSIHKEKPMNGVKEECNTGDIPTDIMEKSLENNNINTDQICDGLITDNKLESCRWKAWR